MRDEPLTDEVLDNIRNWITVYVFHERYSMETHMGLWMKKSLRDVIHEFGYHEKDCHLLRDPKFEEHIYGIDESCHSKIDTKYDLPGVDDTKISHIHLDSLMIADYDEFMQNEAASFMWGYSNHKFGLLDSCEEAAD